MNTITLSVTEHNPLDSELGKESSYDNAYNPKRLYAIPRKEKRLEISIDEESLPFHGMDYWTHYEVSWLNAKGKPIVAIAEMSYDCTSSFIVESKSLKLYFNSLNNSKFNTTEEVTQIIQRDLEQLLKTPVTVVLSLLSEHKTRAQQDYFSGICLDALDIDCSVYTIESNFLTLEENSVTETVYSDLLKSNCLVTTQPDWGSVQITYHGRKINHEGLLRYLVSYRNHNEFHEQCIERIFVDILRRCQPKALTVYGRYTRRGGIDINPYRSTEKMRPADLNKRLLRQ